MKINTTRLRSRTDDQIAALRDVPQDIVNVLAGARTQVERIRRDPDLTPLAKSTRTRAVRTSALKEVEEIRTTAADSRTRIQKLCAEALSEDNDPTDVQLLRELRLQRAWRRAERDLANGKDAAELVQLAAEARDADMIAALRAELPAYMAAAGQPDKTIDVVKALIDERGETVLPEHQQAAKQIERDAGDVDYYAVMAIEQAAAELEGGHDNIPMPSVQASSDRAIPIEADEAAAA